MLRLARTRYSDANHTHMGELLREREGIEIGRTTLRRILTGAGLKSPRRRRPPRHRVRRQRMPREGMLIQVAWRRWSSLRTVAGRRRRHGIVVNALFCEQENTRDYFLLMRGLIQRYGKPIALYTDRHSVFKNVPGSGFAGVPTQFSRAMDELGIQMIFAMSPQAKGRVERTAGTFQDRLVTELRLAGAVTIEEANAVLKEFLDRFNARFGVPAQHPEAAYRPLGSGVCLDTALCFRHSRRVARNNTVKYRWRTLQLLPGTERHSYAEAVVDVLEGLDGELAVRYRGEIIPSQDTAPSERPLPYLAGPPSRGWNPNLAPAKWCAVVGWDTPPPYPPCPKAAPRPAPSAPSRTALWTAQGLRCRPTPLYAGATVVTGRMGVSLVWAAKR